jgi:hypothetical protein
MAKLDKVMVGGVAARLEALAALSRKAERHLRSSPDCMYQDVDSVVVRDTPASRRAVVRMKRELNRLYGKFGVSRGGNT